MELTFEEKLQDESKENYELSALYKGEPAGRLLYRKRGRVRIYELEVKPELRRQGIGSALMHRLVQMALEGRAYLIELFLSKDRAEITEENDILYFLWRCGLEPVDEDDTNIHYEIQLNDLPEEPDEEANQRIIEEISRTDPKGDGDEPVSRLAYQPAILPVTNADLICGNCVYRTGGSDVLACHRYRTKPMRVLTQDVCDYHAAPVKVDYT